MPFEENNENYIDRIIAIYFTQTKTAFLGVTNSIPKYMQKINTHKACFT